MARTADDPGAARFTVGDLVVCLTPLGRWPHRITAGTPGTIVAFTREGRFVVHFIPDRMLTVHPDQIRRLDPTG
jgi:hypothetical protein